MSDRIKQLERKQTLLMQMVLSMEALTAQLRARVQADDAEVPQNDWQQGFYDGRRQAFDDVLTRLEHLKNSLTVL